MKKELRRVDKELKSLYRKALHRFINTKRGLVTVIEELDDEVLRRAVRCLGRRERRRALKLQRRWYELFNELATGECPAKIHEELRRGA